MTRFLISDAATDVVATVMRPSVNHSPQAREEIGCIYVRVAPASSASTLRTAIQRR